MGRRLSASGLWRRIAAGGLMLASTAEAQTPAEFDAAVAALSPRLGGDCMAADPPAAAALRDLGLTVEAAAACPSRGAALVAVALPSDARDGQGGALGLAFLRAHLAQGRAPVVLIDRQRGIGIAVVAAGAAEIATEIEPLSALVAAAGGPRVLFDGRQPGGDWQPHLVRGGMASSMRTTPDGFDIDVTAGPHGRITGLRSAQPLVTLPLPGDPESLRLRFDLDPARLSNAVFALVPPEGEGKRDWDVAVVWLGLEAKPAGAAPELILATQRREQARLAVTDMTALAGLALEIRPDGTVLAQNATGETLLEGRLSPDAATAPLHLQVSASPPTGDLPARLMLRRILHEAVPFRDSNPAAILTRFGQEVTLFDGSARGPHFDLHGRPRPSTGTAVAMEHALLATAPEGAGRSGPGLFSPDPVIWLDHFAKGGGARLRFTFDPAQTSGFEIALTVPMSTDQGEPGRPRFLLHWRRMPDGTIQATRRIDTKTAVLDATPTAMPRTVDLLLTPLGVQVLAEGFPESVAPWPILREGLGLRLNVHAMAETARQPAALRLERIELTRIPASGIAPPGPPAPGVTPLPIRRFFPDLDTPWEAYGLAGVPAAEAIRPHGDGIAVTTPEGFEHGRAGLLSSGPVAVLDARLARTPYRLSLRFDPAMTDSAEVILSTRRQPDLWNGSEIALRLLREAGPRGAGRWRLALMRDHYLHWTRQLTAEEMAQWDGGLDLDLGPGTVAATLSGVTTVAGTGFVGVAEGTAFHMTAHSWAEGYGGARMALTSVSGGWVTPPDMTARERLELVDADDFDAARYIDLLARELAGDPK
ncbi:hypothetical protein SAMN05878503_1108 [Cereibacter ovatus]|uniref:Uncharacterized protein n=1 Tax=Cereibacter ovatus TaxID=439529 RepID=A0A285CX30_9RHOB|nr:hypothetical protein [Cereibacter ovatus]SNX71513.1 hypothetical protein SAMN05878503_1108 [Cereibacter ovatus]